jgi:hypothetical protein
LKLAPASFQIEERCAAGFPKRELFIGNIFGDLKIGVIGPGSWRSSKKSVIQ